ncbi:MAG: FAD-binding oxidoreductase, partial [Deltaproteobacteria bacterium]|nr:FAD-binding oxidoreductase [Deltaproteobacteria bacterium]
DGLTLAAMGASRTLAQIRRQPADIGVSLARMDRILDYEPDDMTVVAEAGLTLGALNRCTSRHGQRLPCDPANPELTTLGALVGAAKSGPLRLSEGGVRDLLIGIRFVGHGGRLIHGGGRVVKNVAGYDLMKVMTGAFGTLGIITETIFKVRPQPENYSLAITSFDDVADALLAAQRAEEAAALSHLEVLSPALGHEFARPGRSVVLAGFAGSRTEAGYYRAYVSNALRRNTQMLTGEDAIANYQQLRDLAFAGAVAVAQLAVLPANLPRCLSACGAEFRAHVASGIAQIFFAPDCTNEEIYNTVARWREIARQAHGHLRVLEARAEVRANLEMFDCPPEPAMRLMRRLKLAFDPKNIFNPGCFVAGI